MYGHFDDNPSSILDVVVAAAAAATPQVATATKIAVTALSVFMTKFELQRLNHFGDWSVLL